MKAGICRFKARAESVLAAQIPLSRRTVRIDGRAHRARRHTMERPGGVQNRAAVRAMPAIRVPGGGAARTVRPAQVILVVTGECVEIDSELFSRVNIGQVQYACHGDAYSDQVLRLVGATTLVAVS